MNIWVIGSGSGVGYACAAFFQKQGANVLGTISHAKHCSFPSEVLNLEDIKSITTRIAQIIELYGIPDCVLFNAGTGEIGSVEETPLEQTQKLFAVNYFGHLAILQCLIPYFRQRKSGHFLFTGSVVYSLCFPFKAQYNASKAAFASLALSLRQELLPYGIFVNMIEPGWIRSDFHKKLIPVNKETSPYRHRFSHFEDLQKDENKKYPDGLRIAQIYWKILQNPKKYPTRIPVGPDSKLFFWVRKFVPYSFFERFLLDRY